jgi:hypothetical protein
MKNLISTRPAHWPSDEDLSIEYFKHHPVDGPFPFVTRAISFKKLPNGEYEEYLNVFNVTGPWNKETDVLSSLISSEKGRTFVEVIEDEEYDLNVIDPKDFQFHHLRVKSN